MDNCNDSQKSTDILNQVKLLSQFRSGVASFVNQLKFQNNFIEQIHELNNLIDKPEFQLELKKLNEKYIEYLKTNFAKLVGSDVYEKIYDLFLIWDDDDTGNSTNSEFFSNQLILICRLKTCLDIVVKQLKLQTHFIEQICRFKNLTNKLELRSTFEKFENDYNQYLKTKYTKWIISDICDKIWDLYLIFDNDIQGKNNVAMSDFDKFLEDIVNYSDCEDDTVDQEMSYKDDDDIECIFVGPQPTINATHRTSTSNSSKQNPNIDHQKEPGQLSCEYEGCNYATASMILLKHHKSSHQLKCDIADCGYTTKSSDDLSEHKSTHDLGHLKCGIADCSFTTRYVGVLKQHKMTHAPYSFKCDIDDCTYATNSPHSLKRHKSSHSQQKLMDKIRDRRLARLELLK